MYGYYSHPGCDCINNFWGPHCEYSPDELLSTTTPTAAAASGSAVPKRKFDKPEGYGAVIFAALALVIIVVAFLIKNRRLQKANRGEATEIEAAAAELDPDGSSTMQGATLVTTEQVKTTINNNDRSPSINHSAFDDNDGILAPPTIEESINRNAFDDNDGILGPPSTTTSISNSREFNLKDTWSPPTQRDFPQAFGPSISTDEEEEVITFNGVNNDYNMNSSPPPIGHNSFAIDSDDSPLVEEEKTIANQEGDEEQPPTTSQNFIIDYETLNSPAESHISPKGSIQSPQRAVSSSPILASPNAPSPGLFPESPPSTEIV